MLHNGSRYPAANTNRIAPEYKPRALHCTNLLGILLFRTKVEKKRKRKKITTGSKEDMEGRTKE
jgi:hypothetical protein